MATYSKNGYSIQRNEILEIPHLTRKDMVFFSGDPIKLRRLPNINEEIEVYKNNVRLREDVHYEFLDETKQWIRIKNEPRVVEEVLLDYKGDTLMKDKIITELDVNGNPVYLTATDAVGDYVQRVQEIPQTEMVQSVDENGDPVVDGNGDPVMEEVATGEVDKIPLFWTDGDTNAIPLNSQSQPLSTEGLTLTETDTGVPAYEVTSSLSLVVATEVVDGETVPVQVPEVVSYTSEETAKTGDRIEIKYTMTPDEAAHDRPGFLWQIARDTLVNPFDEVVFNGWDDIEALKTAVVAEGVSLKDIPFNLIHPITVPMKTAAQAVEEGLAADEYVEVADPKNPTIAEKIIFHRVNIDFIRDILIIESEKGADILSDSAIKPTPSRPTEGPQNWRVRFFWDEKDGYLKVHTGTKFQILDDGRLTSGEKTDGTRALSVRQPGELCDVYMEPNTGAYGNYSNVDVETGIELTPDLMGEEKEMFYNEYDTWFGQVTNNKLDNFLIFPQNDQDRIDPYKLYNSGAPVDFHEAGVSQHIPREGAVPTGTGYRAYYYAGVPLGDRDSFISQLSVSEGARPFYSEALGFIKAAADDNGWYIDPAASVDNNVFFDLAVMGRKSDLLDPTILETIPDLNNTSAETDEFRVSIWSKYYTSEFSYSWRTNQYSIPWNSADNMVANFQSELVFNNIIRYMNTVLNIDTSAYNFAIPGDRSSVTSAIETIGGSRNIPSDGSDFLVFAPINNMSEGKDYYHAEIRAYVFRYESVSKVSPLDSSRTDTYGKFTMVDEFKISDFGVFANYQYKAVPIYAEDDWATYNSININAYQDSVDQKRLALVKSKTGFFRRYGKDYYDVGNTYPLSYRLTVSGYGMGLYLWEQDSVDEDSEYAWFVIQRHVDNTSGQPDISHKSPVHCLYSPAKRPFDISEMPMFFDSEDLLARSPINTIYDSQGNAVQRPSDEIVPFISDGVNSKMKLPAPKGPYDTSNWNARFIQQNMIVTLNGIELDREPDGYMELDRATGLKVPVFKNVSGSLDRFDMEGTSLNSFIYDEEEHCVHFREAPEKGTQVIVKYRVPVSDSTAPKFIIERVMDPDFPEYNMNKTKTINRFVVREKDVVKPWDLHKSATMTEVDSNALINPMEQLAITPDRKFVFSFPTGLTTQRFFYQTSDLDLVCHSSAEFSAFGAQLEITKYSDDYDGTLPENVEARVYEGMLSTLPNGNGMRLFFLVKNGPIVDSDVDVFNPI